MILLVNNVHCDSYINKNAQFLQKCGFLKFDLRVWQYGLYNS